MDPTWRLSAASLPGRAAAELPLVGPHLVALGLLLGSGLATPKTAVLSQSSSITQFVQIDSLANSSSPQGFRPDHDVSTAG